MFIVDEHLAELSYLLDPFSGIVDLVLSYCSHCLLILREVCLKIRDATELWWKVESNTWLVDYQERLLCIGDRQVMDSLVVVKHADCFSLTIDYCLKRVAHWILGEVYVIHLVGCLLSPLCEHTKA